MYFASQITLPENATNAGAVALTLLAVAYAVKLGLDIWRGLRPQPSYDERFASKTELAALSQAQAAIRTEQQALENRLNSRIDAHLVRVESSLKRMESTLTHLSNSTNAELQDIQRALGRLEGTTQKGGGHA